MSKNVEYFQFKAYHKNNKEKGDFVMRKSLVTMGLIMGLSVASTMTAFAGWEQTGATWKYQNADKTYLTNTWQWIDGNGDNVAECYYFNADGIMLANTTTPDGFAVNEQGQWIENGVVQTKVQTTAPQIETEEQAPETAPPEIAPPSGGHDPCMDWAEAHPDATYGSPDVGIPNWK